MKVARPSQNLRAYHPTILRRSVCAPECWTVLLQSFGPRKETSTMLALFDFTVSEFVGFTSQVLLWLLVFFLGFMVLGALRALGLLQWRLEQLEAITPSRLGRSGLKLGKNAPDFILPAIEGGTVSLDNFIGRKVLLVFTQAGC